MSFAVVALVRAWDTRKAVRIRYNLRDVTALVMASVFVIANFYLGNLLWNNIALAVMIVFALVLNRSYVAMAWKKVRGRLG